MLKIAICDDDVNELENTHHMVSDFTKTMPENDFYVRRFLSPYDLFECIGIEGGFHIYILDIIMPFMDGIDVGVKIREKDEKAVIIYLTSSQDYAVKSYKVYAFQYLMKPVEQDLLYNFWGKALEKIDFETSRSFPVKTKIGITAVRYHHIMFVEYSEHVMNFHLSNGTVVTSAILREPFEVNVNGILNDFRFVRPHISFVVNMSFVRNIVGKNFVMQEGS